MKSLFHNIILFVLSIVISFLVLSCILRIFFPIYSPNAKSKHKNDNFFEYSSKYGWFHKKNISTWIETQEYATKVYINNKNLRGKEHPYEKPKGAKRIIVLGDSFAFGLGVEDEETFSYKLEQLFKANGENVEVVNMGVDGFGTTQEWLLLKEEGIKYSPDMIICLFFTGNDIENNSRGFEYGQNKPFFTIKNNNLVLENYPVPKNSANAGYSQEQESRWRVNIPVIKKFLQTHSYAYVFLRLRYNYLLYRLGIRSSFDNNSGSQAWDITKAIFLKMNDYCHNNKIKFLNVLVPTKEQMLSIEPIDIQKKIAAFFNDNKLDYLDLFPSLVHRKDLNFTIDSHWNKKGHEYIAKLLYERLKQSYE
ncbi:MAG: hypothetical protein JW946_04270 [Candidatus Omnitrophica bacterium]|nr:hypothetical protein [Candidatus Omnitrophota bacterium]